jgi:acetyltransferase-like isoleucine patch superfamily enzyme
LRIPLKIALLIASPVNRMSQKAYMRLVTAALRSAGVEIAGRPLWVAPTVHFDVSEQGSIQLGHSAVISQNVVLLTHDFSLDRFAAASRLLAEDLELYQTSGIHIGEFAFIGWGAIILPGITIGRSAIVAAGSVVTRDVPPETVVAGNPARALGSVTEYYERAHERFSVHRRRR